MRNSLIGLELTMMRGSGKAARLAWLLCMAVSVTAAGLGEEAPETNVAPETVRLVRLKLLDWKDAWERKDLDRFVDCYAESYSFKGGNREAFKEFKRQVFESAGDIQVELSQITILEAQGAVVVRFLQRYQSGRNTDVGRKTLKFVNEDGEWKIREEEWVEER